MAWKRARKDVSDIHEQNVKNSLQPKMSFKRISYESCIQFRYFQIFDDLVHHQHHKTY